MDEQVNTAYQQTSIASWISQLDFYGMTLIVITIALCIIIYLLVKISKKIKMLEAKPVSLYKKPQPPAAEEIITIPKIAAPSEEAFVAIAMALHLQENELHDAENNVLTINRVAKFYSPWSSKIYGLRRCPR
jgi:hypothetical protein